MAMPMPMLILDLRKSHYCIFNDDVYDETMILDASVEGNSFRLRYSMPVWHCVRRNIFICKSCQSTKLH